ncbi:hypothetical protein HELRODRAFT_175034 [Helobdella robusta]|uniref:Uncharacterized protein n=1 Tax=Helobdella robusta TaxID=6412 RepID=T1F8R5_HELRO|nr:hypothetical protein HELRODRAFT_175034 [Helobdella robusta]ESO01010.1 hypothetical protein HELRODRAFT_175034 [Helobdella robusta]
MTMQMKRLENKSTTDNSLFHLHKMNQRKDYQAQMISSLNLIHNHVGNIDTKFIFHTFKWSLAEFPGVLAAKSKLVSNIVIISCSNNNTIATATPTQDSLINKIISDDNWLHNISFLIYEDNDRLVVSIITGIMLGIVVGACLLFVVLAYRKKRSGHMQRASPSHLKNFNNSIDCMEAFATTQQSQNQQHQHFFCNSGSKKFQNTMQPHNRRCLESDYRPNESLCPYTSVSNSNNNYVEQNVDNLPLDIGNNNNNSNTTCAFRLIHQQHPHDSFCVKQFNDKSKSTTPQQTYECFQQQQQHHCNKPPFNNNNNNNNIDNVTMQTGERILHQYGFVSDLPDKSFADQPQPQKFHLHNLYQHNTSQQTVPNTSSPQHFDATLPTKNILPFDMVEN